MAKKLILMIGAPGSGKSTDSELIAKRHEGELTSISIDKILQEEIANNTGIGHIANSYLRKGDVVPGSIIMYKIIHLINHAPTDIILIDGLPRSVDQMKELGDELFYDKDIELLSVIEIRVSEAIARKRVLNEDSTEEEIAIFEHEMELYTAFLGEIENYYEKDNLLNIVDGEQSAEEIVTQVDEYLKKQLHLFV